MKRRKINAIFDIFLLVVSIFAIAYIMNELNEKTAVSALNINSPTATCQKTKDGAPCVEFQADICDQKCSSNCYPDSPDNTPGCKLGTCVDPIIGTCAPRTSQFICEKSGGQWFNDPTGNIIQCQKGCCIIGDKVKPLVTSRECQYLKEVSGIETEYKPNIKNELECLALERTQAQGACVFSSENEKSCIFTTKKECLSKRGEFFEGYLCTHPDLRVPYQKQASAKCFDEKLYWVDSAGNKENIYDANKVRSWNNGFVLSYNESCTLGTSTNPLANQKTCGNCNRFLGTVCGDKTETEKLSDNSIGSVCRHTGCIDSRGTVRENGESWCEYQGAIGVDKGDGDFGIKVEDTSNGKSITKIENINSGLTRSVDTPGSRHFRAICIDGEIQIDPCDEYRNKICIEEQVKREIDGKIISTAACITNLWQLCLSYNSEIKGKPNSEERKMSIEERNKKCQENPLCVLKKIGIADQFKFDMCVPKYPAGFDLQSNPEGSTLSCSLANQKCKVIYVKKLFGGWECEVNCGCTEPKFAEQLNDLCMSLGDCGASVNYIGDLTENYAVKNTPKLGNSYLNKVKKYAEPVQGLHASVFNLSQYYSSIGHNEITSAILAPNPELKAIKILGMISGALASVLLLINTAIVALGPIGVAIAIVAAIVAINAFLIDKLGIAKGLPTSLIITLSILFFLFPLPSLISILIFKIIGIGDTKEKIVLFECKPWQPPIGGDKCSECGKDGFECSKYSCQALGVNCRLINEENETNKACINIGKGDISSPIIQPWRELISEGFTYTDETERGVKIIGKENEGCLKENQILIYGIQTNEYSRCRWNTQHTSNFEEMLNDDGNDFDFGLFLPNHTGFLPIPSLSALGVPGFDPNRKIDLNIYIRCIDGNGNGQNMPEYVIQSCIIPGEDITHPVIIKRDPISEYVAYNQEELYGTIYINEPADCKWSFDSTESFAQMENSMECEYDIYGMPSTCSAKFPVRGEETAIYIRCKDQPWYGENWQPLIENSTIQSNESKRNEMPQSYKFTIKKTKTPLEIEYIKPNNETLVFGVIPATVVLEVKTKGGIDNTATCYLFEKKVGNEMQKTFGVVHQSTFDQIISLSYQFPIICKDAAGNIAQGLSEFKVELDIAPPNITRVYGNGKSLVILTNEPAECSFSKTDCDFEFDKAEAMSGTDVLHTTPLTNTLYYIKCRDKWKTESEECLEVRGAEFGE